MATQTETIRIVIQTTGDQQAAAGIRNVASEANAAEKALGLLKVALAAVGVGALVHEYVELSNQYQEIQNRIKLVTNNSQEQAAVSNELLRIANATLTPLEATAELYSRIAFNSRNLGLTQQEVLRITQTLNEATIISGVNSREAKSAVIELTHGLAEGTLHGYQLRSILAQVPFVADLIARHLGVSSDAIRALGAQGKLTAKDITQAFLESGDRVDAQFSKVAPTIGQAFTVISNTVLGSVGDFNSATGAAGEIAKVIISLVDPIRDITTILEELFDLGKVGFTELAALIDEAFGTNLKNAKVTFRDVVLFIAAAIDGFTGLFVGVGQVLVEFFTTVFNNLKGLFQRLGNVIGQSVTSVVNFFVSSWDVAIQTLVKGLNALIDAANSVSNFVGGGDLIQKIALPKDSAKFVFQNFEEGALVTAGQLGKNLGGAFKDGFFGTTGVEDFITDAFKKSDDKAKAAKASADLLKNAKVPAGGGGQSLADIEFAKIKAELVAQQELLNLDQKKGQLEFDQGQALLNLRKQLEKSNVHLTDGQKEELETLVKSNAEKKIRNTLDAQVTQFNQDQQDALDLLNLDTQAREIQSKLLPIINAFKKAGIDLDQTQLGVMRETAIELQKRQTQEQVLNSILGDRAKIAADVNAAEALHDQGKINDDQLQRFKTQKAIEGRQGDTSVQAGVENGLDELSLKITDFASQAQTTITDAFSGAEDALVSFVQTGKLDFSSLVDSILADMTRLLARQALSGLFGALGGGGGGLGEIFGSLFGGGRAAGGPVSGGTPYMVGENGPEIFNPPSNGSITPNNQLSGLGGGANVTIVNVLDPSMVSAALSDPRNQQIIVNGITNGNNGSVMKKRLGVK